MRKQNPSRRVPAWVWVVGKRMEGLKKPVDGKLFFFRNLFSGGVVAVPFCLPGSGTKVWEPKLFETSIPRLPLEFMAMKNRVKYGKDPDPRKKRGLQTGIGAGGPCNCEDFLMIRHASHLGQQGG